VSSSEILGAALDGAAAETEIRETADGDREQAENAAARLTRIQTLDGRRLLMLPETARLRRVYSTMVICDAATSNGLNSPVRPCGSFAVTV